MGFKHLSVQGFKRLSMTAGAFGIGLALTATVLGAEARVELDSDLARKFGDAAAKSEGAAWVLGFVCVACLGLAWKMVTKLDEETKARETDRMMVVKEREEDRKAMVELTMVLREQNLLQQTAHRDAMAAANVAASAATIAANSANTAAAVALADKKDINERALKMVEAIGMLAGKPCAMEASLLKAYLRGKLEEAKA